ETAEKLARRAMSLDPNASESFRILGECALARRDPARAYELGMEALRLSPGSKSTFRLLTRARVRQHGFLKPFLAGVDWIVEMDRGGIVMLAVPMATIGLLLAFSAAYDVSRIAAGKAPALIVSIALALAAIYALVAYVTAVMARIRIWRDLRKISISPKF